MAHEKVEQLKKLETKKELLALPSGTEIIAIYRGMHPDTSYTAHGKYAELDGRYLTILDNVDLPFEIVLDADRPKQQLKFLREMPNRKLTGMSYNFWSELDQNHLVYRVE